MNVRPGQRAAFCACAVVVLLLFAGNLWGQITSQTGAIRGTVVDPGDALVAGAKVALTSERGLSLSKETSADGSFTFPLLDPGEYRLTVEHEGFRRAVLEKVAVRITEVTTLAVRLELGEVRTEVVISAESAVQVNTANATLGNVLSSDVVGNMPLATRNFTFLLASNAGTAAELPNATEAGRGTAVVFVAGQRGTANNLVINGVDANNLGNNNFGNVPVPSPDSIEEFRVQTSLYDASQGKTSGGNINVITKSGTPKYHGEAYEFFRNEKLNANSFFLKATPPAQPRPILKQNQFGGNFGGPVPKLSKTFFFGSYQGTRQRNGYAGQITSAWPVLPAQRTQANIEGTFGLPPGSVDPVAVRLLNLPGQYGGFLVPTGTGAAPGQLGNIAFSQPQKFSENQFNSNFDQLIGDKHKIMGKFFFANTLLDDPFGGQGGGSLGNGQTSPRQNRMAVLSWTYTVSPNVLNEARFGYTRIAQETNGRDPAKLGDIGMSRFNGSVFSGIPLFATLDLNPAFGGISTNNDQASTANTFHFADTLVYTRGRHTFRAGFEYRRYQINLFNNFASRGFLLFNTFTDFLQGNILQAFVGTGVTDRGFRARDASGYFQDDWKITRRVTLNLGIRYDYLGPSTDVKDRLGNFDPSRLDSVARANGGPGLLNGFILPESANFAGIRGTPGVDRSTLYKVPHNNWAPRVGLAWDVFGDGKTAVRGGYGIYYVRISNQMLLQLITSAPFFQLSSVVLPGTPLSNPFPNLPLPADFPRFPRPPALVSVNPASGATSFNAPLLSLNPFERNMRTPYAQQWNLSIQRELPLRFSVEIGYMGSQGVKLIHSRQMNQARLVNAANPVVLGGAGGVPVFTLTQNSSANVNARLGVLGFTSTGLNTVTGNGHSTYNAFVFTLNRRTANMFIQGAYTFSKSIDNNSGSDQQDLGNSNGNQLDTRGVRGLSNFDRTHRIQVTYRYAIPGFKSGAWRHPLGNWEIGGTTTFQSGRPNGFNCPRCAVNLYGLSTAQLFPQVLGDLRQLMQSGSPQAFTRRSVFTAGVLGPTQRLASGSTFGPYNILGGAGDQMFTIGPTASGSVFGNLGRNIPYARDPRQQQWDFYVGKGFPIKEQLRLQFRAEFFNLFNHANFVITNTAVGTDSFGIYERTVGSPRVIQLALRLQF